MDNEFQELSPSFGLFYVILYVKDAKFRHYLNKP